MGRRKKKIEQGGAELKMAEEKEIDMVVNESEVKAAGATFNMEILKGKIERLVEKKEEERKREEALNMEKQVKDDDTMLRVSLREYLSVLAKRTDRGCRGIGKSFDIWCRGKNYKYGTNIEQWDERLKMFLNESA